MYVVRTCIRYGTNMYLGGTKMGGMKRRWYKKPGYPKFHYATEQNTVVHLHSAT